MARIYLSSTFQDLHGYRKEVSQALRSLGHEAVAMEYYVASEERPLDKCLHDVASCDLYIGIFAWRYGYIPEGYDKSITELEYRQAVKLGKACLIFLLDPNAAWHVNLIEFPAKARLDDLRAELAKAHQIKFFSNIQELSALISQAVSIWEKSSSTKINDNFDLLKQRYKKQVANRYKELNPPVFSEEPHRVPIETLYIGTRFVAHMKNESISFTDFSKNIFRTVVLGNPGSGKSTLASKLLHDLSSMTPPIPLEQNLIPILVILREYAVDKLSSKPSIVDFITAKTNSDYQFEADSDFFKYLLESDNVLVVFDGLDEILDTAHRQEIVKDIEAFCNIYEKAQVLVTSRETGYSQAPLNGKLFQIFTLLPFTTNQVEEYVQKWFAYVGNIVPKTKETDVRVFLKEISSISIEITSNPLMLALLCAIYQNEGDIPRNKADIYEKCTLLLIERRDKERGIKPELSAKFNILSVVAYLAHWIYGDSILESGISRKRLIAEATNYLQKEVYEKFDEAEYAASQLIDFFINRAWVFNDIGTNAVGESLYQFTHRTFLEYFAAKYLVRVYRTPEALLSILLPYIVKQEQVPVNLLSVQQISKDAEGAGNILLERLILEARDTREVNLLLFGINCLSVIVPKQSVTNSLISLCVEFTLEFAAKYIASEAIPLEELYQEISFYEPDSFFTQVIYLITESLTENHTAIASALEDSLTHHIVNDINSTDHLAAEATLNLGDTLRSFRRTQHSEEAQKWDDYYDEIKTKILATCGKHIIEGLAPKYVLIAIDLLYSGGISIRELVTWHGTQSLFRQYHHIIYTNMYLGEISPNTLSDLFTKELDDATQKRNIEHLKQIAEVLIDISTPWITIEDHDGIWSLGSRVQENWNKFSLDNDALFGAFLVLAFNYERWSDTHFTSYTRHELEQLIPSCFLQIFIAHFLDEEIDPTKLNPELDSLDFSAKQRKFASKWANGGISIVG